MKLSSGYSVRFPPIADIREPSPVADVSAPSYLDANAMKKPSRLDCEQRAREKQISRDVDARDLAAGHRSAEEIRHANSLFASISQSVFDNARIIYPEKK